MKKQLVLSVVCSVFFSMAVATSKGVKVAPIKPEQTITSDQLEEYKALLERNIEKLRQYLAQKNVSPQQRAEQAVQLEKAMKRLELVHERISMLPVTAQIAQGTYKPQTPGEKSIERLIQGQQVQPNQFQTLLATENLYELFGDSALAKEFGFAMANQDGIEEKISIRRKVLPQWRNWNSIVLERGKEAVTRYAALYEKVVQSLRDSFSDRSAALAHLVIKAPLDDANFQQEMVQNLVGGTESMVPSYRKLLFLVLGFDFTQSEYHRQPARTFNNKRINDIQCAWQVFGRLLIAYREEYCQRFLTLSEMFNESFIEQHEPQWSAIATWIREWKEHFFLDPKNHSLLKVAPDQQDAYSSWKEGMRETRVGAHREARESMNTMLAEVLQAMRSIHARLDVLSIGDAAFNYPYPGAKSQELDPASKQSILIGCLRGCLEQRLALRRALTPTVIHEVFYTEMVSQTGKDLKHVARVPEPVDNERVRQAKQEAQEGNRDAAREIAARIRSYLARKLVTISSPGMDILMAESDQEDRGFWSWGDRYQQVSLGAELRIFNVPLGMQLYASVVDLYGELNAARWGLSGAKTRQYLMGQLIAKMQQVGNYLKALGVPVANKSDDDVMKLYMTVIQEMIPWKKLKSSAYEKVATLRSHLAIDDITDEQRRDSYRAAYRLIWMCIYKQLERLVSRRGNQHAMPLLELLPQAREIAVDDPSKLPVAQVAKKVGTSSALASPIDGIKEQFESFTGVLDPLLSGVASDVAGVREELIGNFKRTGDYSGVVNNANRALGRIGSILPGFNAMLVHAHGHTENLFEQMQDHSGRLLSAMKGMMLYGYWLNRYTEARIQGLQEMLSELLNSWVLQMGMKLPMVRNKLVKALEHASEEDQLSLEQMRRAKEKIRLGWEGKMTADQIPNVPSS